MKTDARVRYTERVIRDVFLQKLKEKPVSKITVTEICTEAEINRATFYKHYEDVFYLLKKTEEMMQKEFETSLDNIKKGYLYESMLKTLKTTQKYALPYFPIFTSNGDPEFAKKLAEISADRFYDSIHIPDTKLKGKAYIYISSGSTGIMEKWIRTGMQEKPEEIADAITVLSNATINGLKALL